MKPAISFLKMLPVIFGVLLLASMIQATIPPELYLKVFTGSALADSVVGTALGSISAGNPVTSYIIGGELLAEGLGITAITAFLLSWITVGIVQLPAEIEAFGKRFALVRNGTAVALAIIFGIIMGAL